MFTWFSENLGTVLVGLGLIAILTAIIINIVKNKRKGKTQCGCSCQNCAMRDSCHQN